MLNFNPAIDIVLHANHSTSPFDVSIPHGNAETVVYPYDTSFKTVSIPHGNAKTRGEDRPCKIIVPFQSLIGRVLSLISYYSISQNGAFVNSTYQA